MRRITIKDIAKELNISVGTVDRAIHGRGRINEETRALIIKKVEELGYKPNSIARVLGKNKTTRLIFLLPDINPFFCDIMRGAVAACEELFDFGVQLDFILQNSYDDSIGQVKAMEEAIRQKPSGIILVPLHPYLLSTPINNAIDSSIPVVTVNLDSRESKRLCYVGQDPFNTGTIIGTLFGRFMGLTGDIAVLNGLTELYTLQQRTEGFLSTLKAMYPGIRTVGTVEYPDNADVAYEISKKLIIDNPGLKGIFANTTFGAIGAGRAIRDLGKTGQITAISYDITDEIKELLDASTLMATVTQNPFAQGYHAVKLIFRYILEESIPENEFNYTRADIIVSSVQNDLNAGGLQ